MKRQGNKLGDWFRWGKSPRAKIFDRDIGKVVDLNTLTTLMRFDFESPAEKKINRISFT